jgi:mono/diheme cytochrome c family protein
VRRTRKRATAIAGALIGALLAITTGCARRERNTVNASDTYQKACARCHGPRGEGGVASAEGPAPRDFTNAEWQGSLSDAELAQIVRGGRGPMPSFEGVLTADEIEAVAGVVRSFGEAAP